MSHLYIIVLSLSFWMEMPTLMFMELSTSETEKFLHEKAVQAVLGALVISYGPKKHLTWIKACRAGIL